MQPIILLTTQNAMTIAFICIHGALEGHGSTTYPLPHLLWLQLLAFCSHYHSHHRNTNVSWFAAFPKALVHQDLIKQFTRTKGSTFLAIIPSRKTHTSFIFHQAFFTCLLPRVISHLLYQKLHHIDYSTNFSQRLVLFDHFSN